MTYDDVELKLLALPADADISALEPYKPSIATNATILAAMYRIIRFQGRAMIEIHEPYSHFALLTIQYFAFITNQELGTNKQSHIRNLYDYVISTAPDLSCNDRFVLFGNLADTGADLTVWDMDMLEVRNDILPQDCVRRSPYSIKRHANVPISFIMDCSGGDTATYDDIMQSLAPLMMIKKPDGVIWWVGDEDSGKSVLMNAIHSIFPDQVTSISMERLDGGRATRNLNGMLGNIAECDNVRVEDRGLYRNLAKHQSLSVHNYHRQTGLEIQSDSHHIFLTVNSPVFSGKSWSAKWRTFVIPFSHPTPCNLISAFTDEGIGQLIFEMCLYANRIKRQGYRYDWSAATIAARTDYIPRIRKPDAVQVHPSLILGGRW